MNNSVGVKEKKQMSGRRIKRTKGELVFDIFNTVFMCLLIVVMLYPIVNQVAISFSSNSSVMAGKVTVLPRGFNAEAYKNILADRNFVRSLKNTFFYSIICTAIQVFMTAMFAYPLSKAHLRGRHAVMSFLVFSMMFGTGGLIPNYLVIKSLGLIDSYWALILPGTINIWNTIVMKNFYSQLPASLEEAAMIDGAGVFYIFIKIVLPLSMPSVAAITLFTVVGAWNTFFSSMIYITTPAKKLLQVYLNDILQSNIAPETTGIISNAEESMNPETLKAAALVCTILPIICVYPLLQRYFMSGLLIGSVKG